MAKAKQHVFSARTTEEGLRLLNGIREEKKIGWDDLVIDAVCAHYGLDRLVMALPKAYRPKKEKKAAGKGRRDNKENK
jgi:predicted nucleic acid-binding protein